MSRNNPHSLDPTVMGPYESKRPQDVPKSWYYRIGNAIEIHLQVNGTDGLMHYVLVIPNSMKKRLGR